MPERLVADLKRFRKFLSRGEDPVANFKTWGWRFFSILMLVLVLAQTAMPTAVYAKGFGGGVSHSGGGSYYGGGGAYLLRWRHLLRKWRHLFLRRRHLLRRHHVRPQARTPRIQAAATL